MMDSMCSDHEQMLLLFCLSRNACASHPLCASTKCSINVNPHDGRLDAFMDCAQSESDRFWCTNVNTPPQLGGCRYQIDPLASLDMPCAAPRGPSPYVSVRPSLSPAGLTLTQPKHIDIELRLSLFSNSALVAVPWRL